MKGEVTSRASRGRVRGGVSTLSDLHSRAEVTTKTDVGVPHGSGTLRALVDVPFDEDGTSRAARGGEDDIGDLSGGCVTGVSDLDGNVGGRLRGELGAGGDDVGPEFTDHEGTGGDGEGVGEDVRASIDVCRSTVSEVVVTI